MSEFGFKVGETVERKHPTWVRVARHTESHRHRGEVMHIYRCLDGPLFECKCEVCNETVLSPGRMLRCGV